MDYVAWLGQIFESGKWPAENYYGLKWDAASFRSQKAGDQLFDGARGVFTEICADLDEFCKTFGFQDYRAKYGCIHCLKSRAQMKDYKTLGKKRTHNWFMQTAMEALTVHNVDEDLAREVKKVCTSNV